MKFFIDRTSEFDEDNMIPEVNPITVKRKSGRDGSEFETKEYEIEVNTLEELLSLVDKYGSIIVGHKLGCNIIPPYHEYDLEIYDTWRE